MVDIVEDNNSDLMIVLNKDNNILRHLLTNYMGDCGVDMSGRNGSNNSYFDMNTIVAASKCTADVTELLRFVAFDGTLVEDSL